MKGYKLKANISFKPHKNNSTDTIKKHQAKID